MVRYYSTLHASTAFKYVASQSPETNDGAARATHETTVPRLFRLQIANQYRFPHTGGAPSDPEAKKRCVRGARAHRGLGTRRSCRGVNGHHVINYQLPRLDRPEPAAEPNPNLPRMATTTTSDPQARVAAARHRALSVHHHRQPPYQ
jgi:hypothetical protein